jgi:hypothetical protein
LKLKQFETTGQKVKDGKEWVTRRFAPRDPVKEWPAKVKKRQRSALLFYFHSLLKASFQRT